MRRKMNRKKSRRLFKKTAGRIHPKNLRTVPRGGVAL